MKLLLAVTLLLASLTAAIAQPTDDRFLREPGARSVHAGAGNYQRQKIRKSLASGAVREIRHAAAVIGGRPAGCPRRFCGCGASLHLFGRIIPRLNLAANWVRDFPAAAPAPNMAAARSGHVMVLKQDMGGGRWLVHDSNSGGGKTRLHVRSIKGFKIVNPRA